MPGVKKHWYTFRTTAGVSPSQIQVPPEYREAMLIMFAVVRWAFNVTVRDERAELAERCPVPTQWRERRLLNDQRSDGRFHSA